MSWIESIKDHLVANGQGTYGVDLFVGGIDDGDGIADLATGLAEYGGQSSLETGTTVLLEPSLQVSTRGPYFAAHDRVMAAVALLDQVVNQDVQGTHFLRVHPQGTIIGLGMDVKGRHQFTFNFSVQLAGLDG